MSGNGDVSSATAAIHEEQIRTKQILERLFPDAPAGPESYHQWIDHIAAHIEQSLAKNLTNNTKQLNNNCSANNSSELNSTNHVSCSENNSSSPTPEASTDDLIILQLQTTANEYKTIIADMV